MDRSTEIRAGTIGCFASRLSQIRTAAGSGFWIIRSAAGTSVFAQLRSRRSCLCVECSAPLLLNQHPPHQIPTASIPYPVRATADPRSPPPTATRPSPRRPRRSAPRSSAGASAPFRPVPLVPALLALVPPLAPLPPPRRPAPRASPPRPPRTPPSPPASRPTSPRPRPRRRRRLRPSPADPLARLPRAELVSSSLVSRSRSPPSLSSSKRLPLHHPSLGLSNLFLMVSSLDSPSGENDGGPKEDRTTSQH